MNPSTFFIIFKKKIAFALLYYLIYFPEGWLERVLYSGALIVFPVIALIASRRTLTWYYARRITVNEERLLELKEEKKTILEEVMENETYKKAKEILEKFDPERQKTMTPPRMMSSGASTPASTPPPGSTLRQRKGDAVVAAAAIMKPLSTPLPPSTPALAIGPPPGTPAGGPGLNGTVHRPPSNTPVRPMNPNQMIPPGPLRHPITKFTPRALMQTPHTRPPVLPRPVLPAERGLMDKMVEYLVGDGPSNRYALICRRCNRHNGMALKEEFEYLSFHCAYCFFLNPAKRKRPSAPRLPDSYPASGRESEAESEAESTTSGTSPKSTTPGPLEEKRLHNGDGESNPIPRRRPSLDETEEDERGKSNSGTVDLIGAAKQASPIHSSTVKPASPIFGAAAKPAPSENNAEKSGAASEGRRHSSTDDDYVKVSKDDGNESETPNGPSPEEPSMMKKLLETSSEPMDLGSGD